MCANDSFVNQFWKSEHLGGPCSQQILVDFIIPLVIQLHSTLGFYITFVKLHDSSKAL
jgi:hypothetical protein